MKPLSLFGVFLAAAVVLAQTGNYQQPFQPSVPVAPSYSGGYGVYDGTPGGATAEGSMMQGMASVISAAGNYNLSTSAAAVNATQAAKQDIQNRQAATNAYFAMRETNRASVNAMRSPRLSQEQLVRLAAQSAPAPITSADFDAYSGQIKWPRLLQSDQFKSQRTVVDQLIAKQAQFGKIGLAEHDHLAQAIESMSDKLRDIIRDVPSSEYISAKNFLKSLMYSVNKTQLS